MYEHNLFRTTNFKDGFQGICTHYHYFTSLQLYVTQGNGGRLLEKKRGGFFFLSVGEGNGLAN